MSFVLTEKALTSSSTFTAITEIYEEAGR
jgi:hypothetical protein